MKRREYQRNYYKEHGQKERKREKIIKYAHELADEWIKVNESRVRLCTQNMMHPYNCDIFTCSQKEDHIWLDLQVIKANLEGSCLYQTRRK